MNSHHQIMVYEMAPHVHGFLPGENKVEKIYFWLKKWIELSLEHRKIKPKDLLPTKADLACHIGVSQGTIQNVFRKLEDDGYVESKQRIGTFIKDFNKPQSFTKHTSKRDLAIEIIKKYILENNYQIGDKLISSRKIAEQTCLSNTTIQLAIINLTQLEILEKKNKNFFIKNTNFDVNIIKTKTLVEKVVNQLKTYIETELIPGCRIPSNDFLSKKYNVSIKTINNALKILAKEGIVHIKRGKYGTIALGSQANINIDELYLYEKIEQKLKLYISKHHNIGDKLPSIKNFAKELNTSEKTVKKALNNLAEEGYIMFMRGRYGGTFVTDIPQSTNEAYKWLALSTEYISNMEN